MDAFIHGKTEEFVPWYDTDGHIINASDGGVIFAEGRYHWYGLALRPLPEAAGAAGGQKSTTGVVMYASDDLLNWEYEGVVLPTNNDPASPLYGPLRFERHNTQNFLECSYVWLPVTFEPDNRISLHYLEEWTL